MRPYYSNVLIPLVAGITVLSTLFIMMCRDMGMFKETPKVGQSWVEDYRGNPFWQYKTNYVVAVSNNWVLYTNRFYANSKEISSFKYNNTLIK